MKKDKINKERNKNIRDLKNKEINNIKNEIEKWKDEMKMQLLDELSKREEFKKTMEAFARS